MKTATAKDVHADFNKAAKRIQKESISFLKKQTQTDRDVTKSMQLAGFANSSTVAEEIEKQETAEQARKMAFMYPQNNFLTEDAVKKICKKYGLLIAEPDRYIGEIPLKNQKEISGFKLLPEDHMISIRRPVTMAEKRRIYSAPKAMIAKDSEGKLAPWQLVTASFLTFFGTAIGMAVAHKKCIKTLSLKEYKENKEQYDKEKFAITDASLKFMIVAPARMLDTTQTKVVGEYQLIDKDPVVLCKVGKYYLQVSCWGDEAEIAAFKNSKKN